MTERWTVLPFHRGPVDVQLALSDTLVRNGTEPTVWWHAPSEATLVLGPSQREPNLALEADVPVVRRASGGTAVYASLDMLGVDVFLPRDHRLAAADVVENYRWFGEVWLDTLESVGMPARLIRIPEARTGRDPGPPAQLSPRGGGVRRVLAGACFASLSPYEVAVGRRKLVGLCQLRRQNGTLLQSAIYHRFDAVSLARLLAPAESDELADLLGDRATGIDQVSPAHVDDDQIVNGFAESLLRLQQCELSPGDWGTIDPRAVQ